MQDSRSAGKVKKESAYERMLRAIDAAPPEYFTGFGITKESWANWRHGGRGTYSGGKLKWHTPTVTELRYPEKIRSLRDWDDWVRAMNMDRRISDRTRRVLACLAGYLNIKTGQCNPSMRHLAMMAGLGEDDAAEVMARTALRMGEDAGWIKRHYRRGGRRYSQSNEYEFRIPDAVLGNRSRPNIFGESTELQSSTGTGNIGTGYIYKIAPVADAPVAEVKRESEKVPRTPIHRKSSSFEEAIRQVEGLIGDVPRE